MYKVREKKSGVWQHFTKSEIDNEIAICSECYVNIRCQNSSTSGLIRHLSTKHQIFIEKKKSSQLKVNSVASKKKIKKELKLIQRVDNKSILKNVKIEPHIEIIEVLPHFVDVTDFPSTSKTEFIPKENIKKSTTKLKKTQTLAEILSRLIADGFKIEQILNSKFIRESIKSKGFSFPEEKSLIIKLIHEFYISSKQNVTEKFENLKNENVKFSISLDELRSASYKRYLKINVYQKNGEYDCLGLIRFNKEISAENIKKLIENRLEVFGLNFCTDIVAVTTNCSIFMLKFGSILPVLHQLCYNEAIQLAILDVMYTIEEKIEVNNDDNEDDFEFDDMNENEDDDDDNFDSSDDERENIILPKLKNNYEKLLKNIRRIVKLFKYSTDRNLILQENIQSYGGDKSKLLLDCNTRWNSIQSMLETFFELKNYIHEILNDMNLSKYWNDIDLVEAQKLLNALKPIKIAVEAFSRKEVNLITGEGIMKFLFKALHDENTDISLELLNAMKKRLEERRIRDLVSLIKFLQNPRSLQENEKNTKNEIIELGRELMTRLYNNTNNDIQTDIDNLDDLTSEILHKKSLDEQLEESILSYYNESEPVINNEFNSLTNEFQLYETTGKLTPNLLLLFDILKTIRPISTETKKVYSTTEIISNNIDTKLNDKNINEFFFIKNYLHKYDEI